MTVNSIDSGIQAFLSAQQRLSASAEQIASASIADGPVSIVEPLIDLRIAETQAKAAAKVIETENVIIGSLLDIKV